MFKDVDNSNADVLILTLTNDEVITIPKYKAMTLTLTVDDAYGISAGGSVDIPYSITGGGDSPHLTIFTQNGWQAVQTPSDATTGIIRITAPADMAPDKVVVIAEDGRGRTVMKTITFAAVYQPCRRIIGDRCDRTRIQLSADNQCRFFGRDSN